MRVDTKVERIFSVISSKRITVERIVDENLFGGYENH